MFVAFSPRPSRLFWQAAVSLLAGAILLLGPLGVFWHLNRPTGQEVAREVRIRPGMTARHIGRLLEEQGLIRSAGTFALLARLQGLEHRLEAGTYRLSGTLSTADILRELLKAPVRTRRVTIPEGLTRQETAGLLARHGVADSTRFLALTGEAALARQLGLDAPALEGYLFPETYFFDAEATEEELIEQMVAEFHRVFADSLRQRLPAVGLTLHEAVTLASLVEREARIQEERPVIAGIFLRRLALGRRLESCATVEYALGVHKDRLTSADLQVDSPYNTYLHSGLPPGPIGNPGRASLLATVFPTDSEYLYFVAQGNGTHIFSRTNGEHERAKQTVRRRRQDR